MTYANLKQFNDILNGWIDTTLYYLYLFYCLNFGLECDILIWSQI
jgi:hypothetical protein